MAEGAGAMQAWGRLEAALARHDRRLRQAYGLTSAQLTVLRSIAGGPRTLAELRRDLGMHPATLGQMVDRLERRELVERRPSLHDLRRRIVELTESGLELLAAVPLAGPARLGAATAADRERLDRLEAALADAVDLFGIRESPG